MDRLFVNVGADGRVSVSTELDSEYSSLVGEAAELSWLMNATEMEDLRWYLEDYLQAPFGVYEQRGEQVANQLGECGRRLFDAVFGAGPARDAYLMLRTRVTGSVPEIVLQSAVPDWLALPWELLRDPRCLSPLVLDGISVSRSLTGQLDESFSAVGERLRVLMVISRPKGAGDVGYRIIARPLLDRLEEIPGQVDLVVLRPPTLDALDETLQAAQNADDPFQVVHFDGHGVLAGARPPGGASVPDGDRVAGQGALVFEKPGGGGDHVPANVIARVLARAEVPIVVLNACQSGAIGKELEAAVATRLLVGGASSVVAMAYRVYGVAASEFMSVFYQRLFAGDRVSDAVTAGRKRLAQRSARPSPKGPMPLADWMIPVHYTRRDVHFPNLRTKGAPGSKSSVAGERTDPWAPRDEFVGRDGLFYQLEVAARLKHVVLLHGPGGIGKTELAKAFGRWWRNTGGVDDPNLVIWHSFEPGVTSFGLDSVLSTIGLQVFGTDFGLTKAHERRTIVLRLLANRRALLVWDNVESAHSMPDPTSATPTLDQIDRNELLGFLADVAAARRSVVLITSRSREPWLGDVHRMPITGLDFEEANEYADRVLAPFPNAQPRRGQRAFGELMEWLDGHPLSMRLTLCRLDTTEPRTLLDELRGLAPLPRGDDARRTTSLQASIIYSIRHLPPNTRRWLVAVSLLHGVADGVALNTFSQQSFVPSRFSDAIVEGWNQVLDQASRVGLLTPLGGSIYAIHPALPAYLTDQWRAEDPDTYAEQRESAVLALLEAYAAFANWAEQEITDDDAAVAYSMIDLQRRTLGDLLGYALDHAHWDKARYIVGALNRYWDARGLYREASEWVGRARQVLESVTGSPPALDSPAGRLWMFVVASEANRQLTATLLDSAEHTFLEIQDMLPDEPESAEERECLAAVYHAFGRIADERGLLDEAEGWHRRSLTINEKLGDQADGAETYNRLGIIALQRGRLNEAEEWFHKSLVINENRRNQAGAAEAYHLLACVAIESGQLDEAESWCHNSLAIQEKLGDQAGAALIYYQLGSIALLRGHLDEAEDWHRKSLTINESLGLRIGLAKCYRQLGIVAQARGKLGQAEDWHHRAIATGVDVGDRTGKAQSFGFLAALATARGGYEEALEWVVRWVTLFDEFPHPDSQLAPVLLALMTGSLGIEALEHCWLKVTGKPIPAEVLAYVEANRPEESG